MRDLDAMKIGFVRYISNGHDTNVIMDCWCLDLPPAYKPTFISSNACSNEFMVSHLLMGEQWNLDLIRSLGGPHLVNMILNIKLSLVMIIGL